MMTTSGSGADCAANHLVERVPTTDPRAAVSEMLESLRGNHFDSLESVYVLDDRQHLLGFIPVKKLLVLPSHALADEIMSLQLPAVNPRDDQERVAGLAVEYGLAEIPVIDDIGKFIGVVPAQALISILRQEHIEDLNRLVGISNETSQARQALEAPAIKRAVDRLPWLLVGLLGSILATFVVSRFENVLANQVSIAFFVPGIVYLADAIGTQTEAIAVRGISLSRNPLQRLLVGELRTGLLIGLALAGMSFPLVVLGFQSIKLAFCVAATIATAGTVATTVGLLFPWILHQLGKDPAFGSGPVATIVQDVLSLWIYFIIVQWVLV
jgi:magnesium transporter